MRSPRSPFLAVGALGAALAAAALSPAAASASSCTFDAQAATVSIDYSSPGEVARIDRSAAGAIRLDGVACGAATVGNTDRVQATGGLGLQRLVIDIAGGPLGPGKTAETDGASEIEVAVDAGTGGEFPLADEVRVTGSIQNDTVRFAGRGVLLTADGDADVTTTGAEQLAAEGRAGHDRLLGAASELPLVLDGGSGNDVLEGGEGDDALDGGVGDDTESGNGGTDRLRQGTSDNGSDTLDGGGSPYDVIDYSLRTADVRVDPDGVADDGAAGELDQVVDSFEYLEGGAGADTLIATQTRYQPTHLTGNGGADTLTGGANYDYLYGGEGADVLTGTGGSDSFWGGPGDDKLVGGEMGDVFNEGDEPGATGADDIQGGPGVDRYVARARTEALTIRLDNVANDGAAGEGDNVRADVESVAGGKGADVIRGSTAVNDIDGGAGDDNITGGDGDDVIFSWGGDDTVDGGTGADGVYGGDGDDRLSGNTGADRVYGGYDDDLLVEPPAADAGDLLNGDLGEDRVSYASRTAPVTVTLDAVANDGATGEKDAVAAEIVQGGAGADKLTGSASADGLEGGAGNDDLDGLDGDDRLDGGTGADDLIGGANRDVADYRLRTAALTISTSDAVGDGAAGEGDDVETEDVLGGSGHDRLTGDSSGNRLEGGKGNDVLDGGTGADVIDGQDGTDTVSYARRSGRVAVSLDDKAQDGSDPDGNGWSDEGDEVKASIENVLGGAGADYLRGSVDPNTLTGNGGDDRLDGDSGADVLNGGSGRDTADYATRSTPVAVTVDAVADDGAEGEGDLVATTVEVIAGGFGNDRLTGGAAAEELRGGPGDDVLVGRGGADVFEGDLGKDTVSYADRASDEPVLATLDGVANDGGDSGAEKDLIKSDIENLTGGVGEDDLRGDDKPNVLSGGAAGTDRLYGRGGDDVLDDSLDPPDPSGDGDDLFGGDGKDLADYSKRTGELRISLDNIPNDGLPSGPGRGAEFDNVHADVENVVGGAAVDVISGSDADNQLEGRGANDRLEGRGGKDKLIGGEAPDRLYGEGGDDDLTGGPGNNLYDGGEGHDEFIESSTRAGNDLYTGGPGRDMVNYGSRSIGLYIDNDGVNDDGQDIDGVDGAEETDNVGTDVEMIHGGRWRDKLFNKQEFEDRCGALLGGGGDDTLYGGDHAEWLNGGPGGDRMFGEGGNDVMEGGQGPDVEYGGGGDDDFMQGVSHQGCASSSYQDISGGDGADIMWGGSGDDDVDYRRKADTPLKIKLDEEPVDGAFGEHDFLREIEQFSGGRGDDLLIGNDDENVISGGGGTDRIEGLGDDDLLYAWGIVTAIGGSGDDEFQAKDDDNADVLDGGSGGDSGEWDAGDTRKDLP